MFSSIFRKPKWQHKDASIRVQAVNAMSVDERRELTAELLQDDDARIRVLVVPYVDELMMLEGLAKQDTDKAVRDLANTRYLSLVCGALPESPALEVREQVVAASTNATLLDTVVESAEELSLKMAALKNINKSSTLLSLVRTAVEPELRSAALDKVIDENSLKLLLKEPKHLTPDIRQTIESRIEASLIERKDPATLHNIRVRLCKKMEQLATSANWQEALAQMDTVDAEWQAAPGDADSVLESRFERARKVVLSTATEYQRLESGEKIPTDKEVATERRIDFLVKRVTAQARDIELKVEEKGFDVDAAEDVLNALEQEWLAEDTSEPKAKHETQVNRSVATMRQQLAGARKRNDGALEKLCESSRRLASADALNKPQIERIEGQWERAIKAHVGAVPSRLQDKFSHNVAAAYTQLTEQLAHAKAELPKISSQVDTLTDQVEEGQLQAVSAELPKLKSRFQFVQKMLRGEEVKSLGRKLARLESIQQDLGGWQHWGNDRKREELCEKMETLAVIETDDLDKLFLALKKVQNAWKQLETAEKTTNAGSRPGASKGMWERFQKASNTTFERCKPMLEAQAAERNERLTVVNALCEKLEQAASAAEIDFKQLAREQANGKRAMRELDQIDRKSRGNIARRLRNALNAVSAKLDGHYAEVKEAKQAIIEKAKQLLEEDENVAVDGVKRLQRDWPKTGTADRKTEQALWKDFRAVCDQIFAKREEHKEQVQAERAAKVEDLSLLVEKMESIAVCEPTMVVEKLSEFRELASQWQAQNVKPNKDRALQKIVQRADSAQEKVDAKRQQHAQQKDWEELEKLLTRHAKCAQFEAKLVTAEEIDQLLEQNPASSIKAGEATIKARVAAVKEDSSVASEANDQAANHLLFDLEILLGVDSPTELHDARMEYQISRLSSDMASSTGSSGSNSSYKAVKQLLLQYIALMPVASDLIASHEQRIAKAIAKVK